MAYPVCRVPCSVFRYSSIRVVGLKVQALPLSSNILMLYGNMEQLTKLRMSIFALLVWTNRSSEFLFKNL